MRRRDPSVLGAATTVLAALIALVLGAAVTHPIDGWLGGRAAAAEDATADPFAFLGELLTPTAVALFDDIERDLGDDAEPLPATLRRRLAPWFDGRAAGATRLDPAILERARYVVDHPRTRELFASLPGVEAITFGDVIAFPAGLYQPACIEGVALVAHELVHVGQYATLGREPFLRRYFVTETLRRWLAGEPTDDVLDPGRNALERDGYCVQARVCRALAAAGQLPGCTDDDEAHCPKCPEPRPTATPARWKALPQDDGDGAGR